MRSRSRRCAAAFLFCGVQTGLEVGARCTRAIGEWGGFSRVRTSRAEGGAGTSRAGPVLPCLQREGRACRGRTLLVDGNYAAAQRSRAVSVRLVGADVLGRPPPRPLRLT